MALLVGGSGVLGLVVGLRLSSPRISSHAKQLLVDNPYLVTGAWYKGNVHVASDRGLGADLPTTIDRWYAARGYAFLGISDVNTETWTYDNSALLPLPTVAATYPFATVLAVDMDHWLPATDLQGAVSWIARDGGLPVLAAPLASTTSDVAAASLSVKGLFGIEVYDARLAAADPSLGDATHLWDELLSEGDRVYAFAGDDVMSLSDPAAGHAWIEVLAPANDINALLSSIRQGAFIATTGAEFVSFQVSGTTITANAGPGSSLRFIGRGAQLLKTVSGPSGSYRANGSEGYVRVEAIGDDGSRAWSQPFFFSWR